MAKDGDAMKRKQSKKNWAPGKRLPKFGTAAEEERFWLTHDFDAVMEARGEEVICEFQGIRRPRSRV
jgi:hypothetical protein